MESDLVTYWLCDFGLNYFPSLNLIFLIYKLGIVPASLHCCEVK